MENSVLIDRYRKWVIQRGTETFPVTENEEGNLEIESKFALGRVNFYEDDIVELRIDMIRDNTTEFFLHFQLKDLKRAQDLYVEMEEAMRSLKDRQVVRIVLSCTSGLTTSYYAELLNAASKTLNLNYEFKAVSYNRLESEMHGKDMLLLAPQVHFERKKLQEKYPNVLVRNIPAQTFGKYDTGTLIEMIKGELQDENALKTPKAVRTQAFFETNKKVLVAGYIQSENENHIIYRYYHNGNIMCSGEIVCEEGSVEEFTQVLDPLVEKYPEIEIIGLSLQGSIEDGVVFLPNHPMHMVNVREQLTEKYHRPVVPFNDANMIVTGIYWLEDRYRSIILYFLPDNSNVAGCGLVVGGHLIRGRQHVAGEVKYTQKVLNLSESYDELMKSEEGCAEIIGKTLVTMTATIGPEAIFVYCEHTDLEHIQNVMLENMEERFIPPLHQLHDIKEYMMTGTFLRCIWRMDDLKRKEFGLTHNPYL